MNKINLKEQKPSDCLNSLYQSNTASFDKLVFSIQSQTLKINKSYEIIKNVDRQLCNVSEKYSGDISSIKLPDRAINRLTILYGSHLCNFNCLYCYTKNMKDSPVDIAIYKQIINQLTSLNLQYTYWPGIGELTLLPEFWKLMKYQAELHLPAVVFSNGSVFYDDDLATKYLNKNAGELFVIVDELPSLHLYIKMWSTNQDMACAMYGVSKRDYAYAKYKGVFVPLALKLLHERYGNRIGIQCLVTRDNFYDYTETILPFCIEEKIPLFAEPLILSGNAAKIDVEEKCLTKEQEDSVRHSFASGELACRKRQYGEMILMSDAMTPGIALQPRKEDRIIDENGKLRSLDRIYFSSYFRN
ncbi:hypothetical protein KJ708_05180, partial [bacterium]|nr:hypothetical protein [bacterium]MBU1917338.1 hypothetical protein [bacterium]